MDNIAIALTNDAAVRVYAADTTELASQAQRLHNSYPIATASLGRTLTAAAMMGAMLKNDDASVTVQIKGDGPLGLILAVTDAESRVRGYCSNPDVELPLRADGKLDVGRAVGKNGYLNVINDNGMGEPYSGMVNLVSGEIAEDLTAYYAESEQVPTAVGLGVLVGTAGVPQVSGGFLVQLMPGIGPDDDRTLALVEDNISKMPSVTNMLAEGLSTDDMIAKILDGLEYNVLEHRSTVYNCNCSKERVERALISIGAKELQGLIDEGGNAEINCSFCDKRYSFGTDELSALILRCTK